MMGESEKGWVLSWGSLLGCSVGTGCVLPWEIPPVPIKYHLRGGEGGKKNNPKTALVHLCEGNYGKESSDFQAIKEVAGDKCISND